jgi:hypothetical protein
MDDPYNISHHSKKNKAQQNVQRRSKLRSSNMTSRLSNKSGDHSFRGDKSMEDTSRVNTSMNYFNQSNYFNSMLSEKGLSKIDLDDNKWIRKSTSRDSNEESFEKDTILPDNLANRLNILIENETKNISCQGSDDELLALSPGRKILEKGKEMVRKSGYGVDFSGKLISKNTVSSILDGFKMEKKYKTSLDLGIADSHKMWLEKKIMQDQIKNLDIEVLNKKEEEKDADKADEPGNDIQGITSTKFSDLYCQDNFENIHQSGYQYGNKKVDTVSSGLSIQNNASIQQKTIQSEESDNKINEMEKDEQDNPKDEEIYKSIQEDSKGIGTENKLESSSSSKMRFNSISRSETDFFDNESFLNMKDNNSLLVGIEAESNSIER